MEEYHDREWGTPLHDDRALFELLTLEGAQAGLSWITILRRREGYRRAFDGFRIDKVSSFGEREHQTLLMDTEIIRNRQKIDSTIGNARRVLDVQKEHGSLDAYVWSFVDGRPLLHGFRSMSDLPSQTPESEAMSRALRKRGFGFVGPTICYAFMQAAGLVNDHVQGCAWYVEPA